MIATLLLGLLAAAPQKPVPVLKRPAKLDGRLSELEPRQDSGDAVTVQAAMSGSSLWIGARGEPLTPADTFELWLRFKDAGLGARPFLFTVTRGGVAAPESPEAAPAWVLSEVKSAWGEPQTKDGAVTTELLVPAKALPRFPSRAPLRLELCATFKAADTSRTSCRDFDRPPATIEVELSEAIIPPLKPPPQPSAPLGLEGRKEGWAGYPVSQGGLLPLSVWSDHTLKRAILTSLVAEKPLDPQAFGLAVSDRALSPRKRPLVAILDGESPFRENAPCNEAATLRLGLYELEGKVGRQVLEAPAADCALGRAVSLVIDERSNGAELRLSYSQGRVVSFLWSQDHYERTEYGYR